MNNSNFRSISMSIEYPFTNVKEEEEELGLHNEKSLLSSSQNQKKRKNNRNNFEYSLSKKDNSIYHSSLVTDVHSYFWDDDLMDYPSKVEELIKTKPDYYPLERTHTIVYLKNLRDIVIPNLRHCFRTLGIQVIMDNGPAAADYGGGGGASLITKEYIDIHLYFWKMQKKDKTNNEDTRIYLELQRRQGDSIQYHYYVKQILKAANATTVVIKNQDEETSDAITSCNEKRSCINTSSSSITATMMTTTKFFPPPLMKKIDDDLQAMNDIFSEASISSSSLPLCTPSFSHGVSTPKVKKNHNNNLPKITARATMSLEEEATTTGRTTMASLESSSPSSLCSIQMTITLLKSKKFDSQMLGMESLCILTDPTKTNRSIAYRVSHDIIFGNDDDSSFLHTLVFKLILLLQQQEEEPLMKVRERTTTTQQPYLENRDDVNDDCDSDYYYGDNDDHVTYLFQQHDDDDDNNDDGYDIGKLLPNFLGRYRKSYHRSVVVLRNYALTIISNAWEVLISHFHRQNLLNNNNNKESNHEGSEEKETTSTVTTTTTTINPKFSSAVIMTATKIIINNNNRNDGNSKMKSQQQHRRNKEEEEYHHSENSDIVSNDTIFDLIIQSLWKDIAFANNQPHNACLAIKCLLCLFRCSSCYHYKDNKNKYNYDNNNDILSSEEERCILQRAEMIGKATNQRLELLSQELLRQTA